MLILNSGGTFNKRYNKISGELEVPYDNFAIEKVLDSIDIKYDLAGVVYKDSLEMNSDDRKMLAGIIMESKDDSFVIVHGTDTIHLTAEFLAEVFDDRKIILTGAMKPLEVDPYEATLNLGIAIGFVRAQKNNGVYICMNGYTTLWNKLEKNKELGKFEIVS
jgi:L-asparaginase